MGMINLNIRIDEDLKQKAESIFAELGLSMTAAFTIFAKAVVRERRIPFDLALDTPNAETLAAIEEAGNNRGMSRTFNSVDELMGDLNA